MKVFLLFFILGWMLYANSFNNAFLMDDYIFLKNPVMNSPRYLMQQWNPYREQALGVVDQYEQPQYYRPLAHTLYDAIYSLFKNNYWQYHLLNLCLLVGASLLIYLFIYSISDNFILSFLSGFFYLIHPINGIVVNYISASVFALEVICIMGAMVFLQISLNKGKHRLLYALSLFCSFLALFWHESGIMTPFYLAAFVIILRPETVKEKILCLVPYFLIAGGYLCFSLFFIHAYGAMFKHISLLSTTFLGYGANLFQVFSWYLTRLLYPQGIVMAWVAPILDKYLLWDVIGSVLLIIVSVLFLIQSRRHKIVQLALFWMILGFAPACMAVFSRPDMGPYIEPHWFIFSSIGFFIVCAYGCARVLKRVPFLGGGVLCVLIFVWSTFTYTYNPLWANQKTYALYWSKQVPDLKRTYFYLGYAYQQEGALGTSEAYYRRALSGHAMDIAVYTNLADIAFLRGHFKNAENLYTMVLSFNPNVAAVHNNLGDVYRAQGQWFKAKASFEKALMLNPLSTDARLGLAFLYLDHQEYSKALQECFSNLAIIPNDAKTLLVLINILYQQKDFVSLKEYTYRVIHELKDVTVLMALGHFMQTHQAPVMAIHCFEQVIKLVPEYKEAYLELGSLFMRYRQYDEALRVFKQGASIDILDQRFKNSIDKLKGLR